MDQWLIFLISVCLSVCLLLHNENSKSSISWSTHYLRDFKLPTIDAWNSVQFYPCQHLMQEIQYNSLLVNIWCKKFSTILSLSTFDQEIQNNSVLVNIWYMKFSTILSLSTIDARNSVQFTRSCQSGVLHGQCVDTDTINNNGVFCNVGRCHTQRWLYVIHLAQAMTHETDVVHPCPETQGKRHTQKSQQ